ncbi:MAG: hypothetical protein WCJ37_02930 [Syntrophus sp. (in: bacteria)]
MIPKQYRAFQLLPKIDDSKEHAKAFIIALQQLVHWRLVKRKIPASIFDSLLKNWTKEASYDVAIQFFVDKLYSASTKEYLLLLIEKGEEVYPFVTKFFDHYISDKIKTINPHTANFRRRLKLLLNTQIEKGMIEFNPASSIYKSLNISSFQPDTNNISTYNELLEIKAKFPSWNLVQYSDEEDRVSPIISTEDLCKLVYVVFKDAKGWIRFSDLCNLLTDHLNILDYRVVPISSLSKEDNESDIEEWIDSELTKNTGGFCIDAESRLVFKDAFNKLSARQKDLFKAVYIDGLSAHDVFEAYGIKKSIYYDELSNITKIIKKEIEEE